MSQRQALLVSAVLWGAIGVLWFYLTRGQHPTPFLHDSSPSAPARAEELISKTPVDTKNLGD